ncbi:MAG: DUF362 domain-containing protein [Sphaerochaetaceae bacterium]|nr:DUF362 domain-containing protein [Sphaerochaetaceae bacterium]
MNKTTAAVAITRCATYSKEDLTASLKLILDEGGMMDVTDKTILLKPNLLSDAPPEKAITTRGEVVEVLIRLLYERGAKKIYAGDSPGIHTNHFIPKHSGIYDAVVNSGAQWIHFSDETVMKKIPYTYGRKLPLPAIIDEVDYVFSVAKMKTHQLMYITGSVKNLFGLVPGLHKSGSHLRYPTRESFSRLICGLYKVNRPQFSIIDGIISMEGAGPANGVPRYTGLLLGGREAPSVDTAMSVIMGVDPSTVPLLETLHKKNLTDFDRLEDIPFPLLSPSDLVIEDYKRIDQDRQTNLFNALIGPFFTRKFKFNHQKKEPRPIFIDDSCIGCGRCITICPGKALSFSSDRKISADYKKCIRCYCCHEVCPADAIEIEQRE